MWWKVILAILAVTLLAGCQPIAALPVVEASPSPGVTGNFDFSIPDWGLKHGWFTFDVKLPATPDGSPTGMVRWVELNDALELRYVMATPICAVLSEDGTEAVLTIQIDERYGWGEGTTGQYLNLYLKDGGSPGEGVDGFATPFWPPQDDLPECTLVSPEMPQMAVRGDLHIHSYPAESTQ